MSTLFISHSSANNDAALAVATWLAQSGWTDYFLDVSPQQGLAPGERWQAALKSAADRCDAVLFLISPAWRDSRWCLAEFLLAKQLGKKIFGVLIEATPLESLPREITAEWQLCDLVAGSARVRFTVGADGVVPETEVSFSESGLTRLRFGLQKAGVDPSTFSWPPPRDPDRAPYRGLKSLDVDDAAVFFGRDAAITRGLDALRAIRELGVDGLFVILGASGSGKSSYLRAGLWPRLARDERQFLPLPIIRPHAAVLTGSEGLVESLYTALRARNLLRTRAEIRSSLQARGGLRDLAAELQAVVHGTLDAGAPVPTVLVSIDQAEELFVAEGRSESDQFLSLLAEALDGSAGAAPTPAPKVLAILAIRSDSYDRLQSEASLLPIRQVPFNLSPIPRAEFKKIITGPADQAVAAGRKLKIDPALTELLLQDAEGADALPLLAFALERLFVDYGGDGELSAADYAALGGVRGSIEAAVDAAFANPTHEPAIPADRSERERLLRRAFIPWLARIDPDTEERRRRLAAWDEIPSEAQGVVTRLVNARLLVRDRRTVDGQAIVVVEVAHEALLRQWRTLTAWLDEDADALKSVEAIGRAAQEWTKNNRQAAWLVHTGERLQRAETLRLRLDFTRLIGDHGEAYLTACRARDDEQRAEREAQSRRIAAEQVRTARAQRRSAVALALIAVVLAGFAAWVVTQTRSVARDRSAVLTVAAEEALSRRDDGRALRFGVLAARTSWLSPAVSGAEAQLARAAYRSPELVRVAHPRSVTSAAFSRDGARLLTVCEDDVARILDARSGKEIVRFSHEGTVRLSNAAISLDEQRVVVVGFQSLRLFDARTGKEMAGIPYGAAVSSVSFSADGQRVLTSSFDWSARIFDARTLDEVGRVFHDGDVYSAAFSPDGSHIVTASGDKTARVFDAHTFKEIARVTHEDAVTTAAFSPDGTRIVTGSGDHTARVSDAISGREIARVTHGDAVYSVAFSQDGRRIATGSGDKTARVSDAASGAEIAVVRDDDYIRQVAFSPDGSRLVAVSGLTARVADASTGSEIVRIVHDGTAYSAAFSPDGGRVVTASEDKTVRIAVADPHEYVTPFVHDAAVAAAVFSADGRRMATASGRSARIFEVESGRQIGRLAQADVISALAFSPDGGRILTAVGNTARVSEVATGKELARVDHGDAIDAMAFSRDGERIATASRDMTARISDARTGRELARVTHDRELTAIAFAPDGRTVVTASTDRSVRISDASSGRQIARAAHDREVKSAVFSPDGQRIVTASVDNTARVLDARTGAELARVTHTDAVESAAFSPDGTRIATASWDRTARVSSASTGKEIARVTSDGQVTAAIFSPDGKRIAAYSLSTATISDAESGKEIARFEHDKAITSLAVSPDGRRLLTASDDGAARLWNIDWTTHYGESLIAQICDRRLVGARRLTADDVAAAPLLAGREGEDVCAPASLLVRLLPWLRVSSGR